MKWSNAFFAFPLSLGISAMLASSCGTPGLGLDGKVGTGGTTGTGGHGGIGGTPTSSSSGFVFDSGPSDATFGLCVPKTCAGLGATCGPQGDGCGGLIQCGNCKATETCGGAGTPSVCGTSTNCVAKTCADWNADCGPVSDGCGGVIQCGNCSSPQTCGGGGMASKCGGNSGCIPTTCAAKGVTCGPIGDGCGGLVQCGNCSAPETCGGGGVHGQCGVGTVDAGATCTPKTTCPAGENCGPAGDGCGGQIDCGTCTAPQTCGGGGTPSVCGGNSGCKPKTCAQIGFNCGPAGDGCGGTLQCGTCTAPATCGGGGAPGVCGGKNNCVPATCASLGMNCGPAGDGCGGLLQCGSCTGAQICGGGGQAGVCGPVDGGGSCTGLCLLQQTCPGSNVTTTITGKVYAPNGTDPLYNAAVYVPNGGPAPTYGVTAFTSGVHCGQCGSEISGSPLVSTTTAPDGTFELQNVPVGTNIPMVIQLGRWRRKITIPTVTACTNTALGAAYTTLPSNQPGSTGYPPAYYPPLPAAGDPADNIPLMAFSTGKVDGLECVLLKIGIAQTQFSDPAAQGGGGRVRFYQGEGARGARISTNTPSATQLFGGADGGATELNQYDMVYFPCQGAEYTKTPAQQNAVLNYTSAGGRIFATHFSYVWFINSNNNAFPFSTTATWAINGTQPTPDPQTGFINTAFDRGHALAQWLQIVGASTTYAQMSVNTLRGDFTNVVSPSLLWVSLGAPPTGAFTYPMHYTFDTPVGNTPATQCGRALFDDFHVEDDSNTATTDKIFPAECNLAAAMTPQEKMLEFMIFDLGSCITPTVITPPTCTPTTCAKQGFTCGPAGDGCGAQLDCGACTPPLTCGGGGTPGVCGGTTCNPTTCAAQGIQCGPASDGCGGLQQCGNCPNGTTCGGGGQPGICGKVTCTKLTCAQQNIQCGPAGDGCGGLLLCGSCPPGTTCGGGGTPGKCGGPDASACTPITCAMQMIQCGPAGDGCGGQLDCGPCTPPQTCGGGGMPGICGAPTCTATTCATLGLQCGPAGDGCGGVIQCGTCPSNQTCGGCGTPGMCGSCCKAKTCADQGISCGPAGDGCGGLLQCGTCTSPDTCGGGGISGKCGHQSTG